MRTRFQPLLLAVATLTLAAVDAPAQSVATTAPTGRANLHLCSTSWSPFTNEAGKPRYAIELVDAALKRLGLTADTAIIPDGELTSSLLQGRFDGSPALWRSEEREAKLVYSKPYLENQLVLVALKGHDVSAPALPALEGRRIALVDGWAYGDALKVPRGPTYVPSKTIEDSLQKVLHGEVEYALMDALVIEYLVQNYPEEVKTRLAIGTEPMLIRTLHFALSRKVPGAESIVARFDAEITKMVADHSYHQLLRVGWVEADVNGDGRTELVPASDQAGSGPPVRRYETVTVSASPQKTPGPKRFFIGGQVYENWKDVPDRYKVMDTNRTPWGSQSAPIFSFKWN